jgi:hypothetical protein
MYKSSSRMSSKRWDASSKWVNDHVKAPTSSSISSKVSHSTHKLPKIVQEKTSKWHVWFLKVAHPSK